MTLWNALLPAAMVGTARQAPVAPAQPGEVGALLSDVAAAQATPAGQLLAMAAVLANCAAAAGPTHSPLPEYALAAAETLSVLDQPDWLACLPWLWSQAPLRLQQQYLLAIARREQRLPHVSLPEALEAARANSKLHAYLPPVLGERGRWLAQHNPAWAFALSSGAPAEADSIWEEGNLAQRVVWLSAARRRDPATARARLQAALPILPARERAALLETFVHGLSADDEMLLDSLSQRDRSRDVRDAARTLLLRLPDSRWVQQVGARLASLLDQHDGVWLLRTPTEFDPDWKQDGVEMTPPQYISPPISERTWWLSQLLAMTPLSWWCSHTGMSLAGLLDWASEQEHGCDIVRAWSELLLRAPDREAIAQVMVHPFFIQNVYGYQQHALQKYLPADLREPYWLSIPMEKNHEWQTISSIVPYVLEAYEQPESEISAVLSASIIEHFAHCLQRYGPNVAYEVRQLLLEVCCVFSPDSMSLALARWRPILQEASWLHTLEQLAQVRALIRH